ncbi:hypothetical protein [Bacillus nitratireducens]|uniref:hypothetical protein n=1 Tax=Bacillus nitratireducens TaxID=2026193 RepID=UPI000BEDC102|nr:hypothetical protein [Bacillus nitratireducens]PEE14910.1 hypothetical protein CON53_27430 [Bacillus cereus]MED0906601.1 hypothetical protein [Bacillus nitratireducens]PES72629.1 hypothetical protein CN509_27345 [Bacillus cereus]PET07302.1 hypothetical protein CN505_08620 [Bacillus cereus]PFH87208.1 hypothetical protein COI81_17060 [Bacillus cereus]
MIKKNRIGTIISIIIPVLSIVSIVNVAYKIILTEFFGVSILLPVSLCPIGFILAIFSYQIDKDIGAKIGIILNVVVFLIPFIWVFGRVM